MDEHIRLLTQIAGDVGEIKGSVTNLAKKQDDHEDSIKSLEGSRNKVYGFLGGMTLLFGSVNAAILKAMGH